MTISESGDGILRFLRYLLWIRFQASPADMHDGILLWFRFRLRLRIIDWTI